MKRALILTALLLGALLLVNHYRQQSPAAVLSRYPQTPYFTQIVNSHLYVSARDKTLVLSEDRFDKTLRGGFSCSIRRGGERVCWAGSELWGSGRELPKQSAAQLAAIRSILSDMPPTLSTPDPKNLLIIGYWHNGQWATRIYDNSRLPWQLKQIHKIVYAR